MDVTKVDGQGGKEASEVWTYGAELSELDDTIGRAIKLGLSPLQLQSLARGLGLRGDGRVWAEES